ncbi:MAG TPA: MoxR family ATPase [Fibrobacteria bacterium]|nr:MoxR family ATPase [Fibrobacteria bacterium]
MDPIIVPLVDSLETVLLGKPAAVRLLVQAMLADGHVLLEDVPGTGKTTLARALAVGIGADFRRIQFTPDLLPSDVTGGAVFRPATGEFELRKGPVFANVLLADEINRASPRTQSALLEAMEERQVTLEGETLALPDPFMVLATQNPVEFHGVHPLPEAQMDRFLVRLEIGYPDEETERRILTSRRSLRPSDARVASVMSLADIVAARQSVRNLHMDRALEGYVVALVRATRAHPSARLGASPRAALALGALSQAIAWMDGRDHVMPEDVQEAARPVLCHRVLAREASAGASARIVEDALRTVPVPA